MPPPRDQRGDLLQKGNRSSAVWKCPRPNGFGRWEDENAKLKKLLAEAMLDIAVLKDITGKKW